MVVPHPFPFTFKPIAIAALMGAASGACAQAPEETRRETDVALPTVRVRGASSRIATEASISTSKSAASLYETPQSITVLTREQLDERGVQSLTDALQGVAGVVSGQYGRRGWDDYIVRGMRATESIYLDGLKQGSDTWIAQEPFGVERIEVLKGPASVNFGLVQPGGMVNQVSKRPRADPFTEVGFTLGNFGMRQGTLDMGRPLSSDGGKGAWRLVALASHSDDPTNLVYYKKRYIAPSLTLDLGPDTDLTLQASHLYREYIRQQGLSPYGTLLPNPNGALDRSLFAGDPSIGPYVAWVGSAGWSLAHRFGDGWTFRQNVRAQQFDVDGRAVFHGTLAADRRTQGRTGRLQDIPGHSVMADQSIEGTLHAAGIEHRVMAGVDLRRDIVRFASTTCSVPALDLYNPTYGVAINCPAMPTDDDTTTLFDVGLYLRDRMRLTERLTLSLAGRYDHARVSVESHRLGQEQAQAARRGTGNAGLMYEWTRGIAPYVSWANSFYPVSGNDAGGAMFKPETGRQVEAGVKLQSPDRRVQGALALYELVRRNVTTSDPNNTGYSIQTGEQRARGFEAEVNAELQAGWTLGGAYAYTDGKLTKDTTASRVGRSLDSVPKHGASVQLGRRWRDGVLRGWSAHGGLRYESAKRGFSFDYVVPGYTVADVGVGYQAQGWRAGLNIKNLFDRDYFAGGLNNNVLPLGTPRQWLFNVLFEL